MERIKAGDLDSIVRYLEEFFITRPTEPGKKFTTKEPLKILYRGFTIEIRYVNSLLHSKIKYNGNNSLIKEFIDNFETVYFSLNNKGKSMIKLPEGEFSENTEYDTGSVGSSDFFYENGICLGSDRDFITHLFIVRQMKLFLNSIIDSKICLKYESYYDSDDEM